ncbi:hypothetical protein KCU85_g288, partial [Aureobasidium melanogenum]
MEARSLNSSILLIAALMPSSAETALWRPPAEGADTEMNEDETSSEGAMGQAMASPKTLMTESRRCRTMTSVRSFEMVWGANKAISGRSEVFKASASLLPLRRMSSVSWLRVLVRRDVCTLSSTSDCTAIVCISLMSCYRTTSSPSKVFHCD